VFGLIHIMVEPVGWSEYFRERLQQIVMEQSYLDTLDRNRLTSLQTSILKAEFKYPHIDREGGFYNYLHSNLHHYIASPYREDVSAEMIHTDSGDCWEIFDRVTYICRKTAAGIQPDVSWSMDPDEYVSIEAFKIEIQLPYTHKDSGKKIKLYDSTEPDKKLGDSLVVSLADYNDVDGLIVIVSEEYKVRKDRFQYWTMPYPTKNFDITLTFPVGHRVQSKPMVLSPDLVLTTVADGYYKAKYDFWMLPNNGMAWKIVAETQAAPANA
jgi:septum formation topological specificity factor MinE